MPKFQFMYYREQRCCFEVEAEDAEAATEAAWKKVETLELSSPDDESDDPGELEIWKEGTL